MIKIVTDSVSDLPEEVAEEMGITVVPLCVQFGTETFKDNVDITTDEFYRRLVEGSVHPTTSAGSAGDFLQTYEKLFTEGASKIIVICVSSKLSAVHETALQAKEMMTETEKGKIKIIDSTTVLMSQGLLAIAAARMAAQGKKAEEIIASINKNISLVHNLIILDTVKYANLGGRVKTIAAPVLKLVKPVLTVKDGEVVRRGLTSFIRREKKMIDFVKEFPKVQEVALEYSPDSEGETEKIVHSMKRKIKKLFPDVTIYISKVSPVIGTHAGPGALGISVITEAES